jgi:PDDEXK-like domain of unknown function (DUF3799)
VSITSRMPRAEYDAIEALSITRLKELKRSPQHYRWALTHRKESDALTLGIATHVAVLEPERFDSDFAIWTRSTDAGAMAPRRGQYWDEFSALNAHRTILTPTEGGEAKILAAAVRADATAMRYLAAGDPEITMQWQAGDNVKAKGRADWATVIDGVPTIVGLKTARDVRHFQFGAQAAKLEYGMQWAWYHDGYEAITGKDARMIEVVVESAAPYPVATYVIDKDILLQGRDNYLELLKVLAECEATDTWPGPVVGEQILTLPSWYYGSDATEDILDLDLER